MRRERNYFRPVFFNLVIKNLGAGDLVGLDEDTNASEDGIQSTVEANHVPHPVNFEDGVAPVLLLDEAVKDWCKTGQGVEDIESYPRKGIGYNLKI